jgi:hypothetical protein
VPYRLVREPELDLDHHARGIIAIFDLATRIAD